MTCQSTQTNPCPKSRQLQVRAGQGRHSQARIPTRQRATATHTGAVLAPDTDRGQVPTSELTVVEELVDSTTERAATRIDLGPRLPDVVVRELERLLGDDGAVAEEGAALGALEALVVDLEQVREDVGRLERHVRVRGCGARGGRAGRITVSVCVEVTGNGEWGANKAKRWISGTHIRGSVLCCVQVASVPGQYGMARAR